MATPCTINIERSLFGHFTNKFSVERVATGGGGGADRRGCDSVGADLWWGRGSDYRGAASFVVLLQSKVNLTSILWKSRIWK